jgi:REP element-mobilizing transposase RayT
MQKELPIRKKIRLDGYDYSSAGYYFITMCVKGNAHLFGEVSNGTMRLNEYGIIAENELLKIPFRYDNCVQIPKHIVMPNHIHMIVAIPTTERINPFPTKADIPNIVGKYKAGVTRIVGNAFMRYAIWQPRFQDHIIRNEEAYRNIWRYIDNNPAKWAEDDYFVKK